MLTVWTAAMFSGISNTNDLTQNSVTTITNTDYSYEEYYQNDIGDAVVCVYPPHGARILTILYSLFFMVGFLGNLLVIWVILIGVKLRSMTDICLLNLAIADLLLVSSLPFLAYYAQDQWIFGSFMCTMVLGIYHIGFYSGIFFIVLMSFDRYLAVVHAVYALKVRTKNYGILASMITWAISVIASFPELLHLKITISSNQTHCTSNPTTNQTSFLDSKIIGYFKMNIMGLIVPILVIGYCYSMILAKLLSARSSRKQAMRLVIVVMIVFFCCWGPYNMAAFVKALEMKKVIEQSCERSKAINLSLQITEALAYSHSCINPVLYVFVGEKFRRHLIRLLQKTPISRLQVMKDYLMQAKGSVYSQTTSVDEQSMTAV